MKYWKMKMKLNRMQTITLSALFMSLAFVLPFLTAQIPEIGQRLLPMHLPILICGFVCGPKQGGIVGFISPLLRSLILTMPPLFPMAIAMAFELATYGIIAGLLFNLFPPKIINVFITLILAMIFGRIVWGGVTMLLFEINGSVFTVELFLGATILNAIPGIILQILLIPSIIKLFLILGAKNSASKPSNDQKS